MPKRVKELPAEVPLARAGRKLSQLVRRLPEADGGRIALTVRGQVRAWLVAEPEPPPQGSEDDQPTRTVTKLVRRALKAARE